MIDPWNHSPLTWVPLAPRLGAWSAENGEAYPVTNGVMRLGEGRLQEHSWILKILGLRPAAGGPIQSAASVASFGFQWSWDNSPRTEVDLRWRTLERFGVPADFISGKVVLDAGCGAGTQASFLAACGAQVIAAELSSAVDVAAHQPNLMESTLIQGDLAHLPLDPASVDVVYCEGVLQHTQDVVSVLKELARVLRPGGTLLATHYLRPTRFAKRVQWAIRETIRGWAARQERETVFFMAGVLAALSQIPGLGTAVGLTAAVRNRRMPTFKATWSATYDAYGLHEFQRYLTHAEFSALVEEAGFVAQPGEEPGVINARRAPS